MNVDPRPYLVGIGAGTLAFLAVTPILRVPPSFGRFALRSLGIFLGTGLGGFYLAERRLGER